MAELVNPDDYPNDTYDDDAWLAVPPPVELGSALRGIVQEIVSWDAQKRADMQQRSEIADEAIPDDVWDRINDALEQHPVAEPMSCQEVTTIAPWAEAILGRVGGGAYGIVLAVAARDHNVISAEDFATVTGWWVKAGLSLPEPISDVERGRLVDWWRERGASVWNLVEARGGR